MDERINDKIEEIKGYLEQLRPLIPSTLEGYISDYVIKAACERFTEKIIIGTLDLAFLVLNDKKFPKPEIEEIEVFDILNKNNIISEALCKKLKDAKHMRNFLAHEYGEVDDEIVFHAISEQLEKDVNEFIEKVKRLR